MKHRTADVPYCGVRRKVIESANPVLDEWALRELYRLITRRYQIHIRKDIHGKPAPWTNDPILQQFRFTNVRREHDRESKWLIEHISTNNHLNYGEKLLNTVLFRCYNKHETAELLGVPILFDSYVNSHNWNPEWYRSLLEAARADDPDRVFFTGAFITGGLKRALRWYLPNSSPEDSAEMRVLYFIQHLQRSYWVGDILEAQQEDQKAVYQAISNTMGLGSFLGYQIFVDFTYIPEFPFSENEFVIAGPGCKSGLDYLFKDRDGMTHEECLFWLRDNIDRLFHAMSNTKWDTNKMFWDLPEYDRYMNVMSLENCFCELSKYIRAKQGTGRPKQRYKSRMES